MTGPPTTPAPATGGGRPELMWFAIAACVWLWIGGISWFVIASDDEDAAIHVAQDEAKEALEADDDSEEEALDARLKAAHRASRARAKARKAKNARRDAKEEVRLRAEIKALEEALARKVATRGKKSASTGSGAAATAETQEEQEQREQRESEEVNKLLADLAAAKARGSAVDEDARAGLPKTLNSGLLASNFRRQHRRFTRCYRKEQPEKLDNPMAVQVALVISNSGAVSTASVTAGAIDESTKACLVRALRAMKFPEFRDLSQAVKYPIMLR